MAKQKEKLFSDKSFAEFMSNLVEMDDDVLSVTVSAAMNLDTKPASGLRTVNPPSLTRVIDKSAQL